VGPSRDNKSEGVAFGIEMEEDKDEEGRALSLENNGVRGKDDDDDDDDDVTENEMNSASPKTEGYLISQRAPKCSTHTSLFCLFFFNKDTSLSLWICHFPRFYNFFNSFYHV
jgi:hypothetical protein